MYPLLRRQLGLGALGLLGGAACASDPSEAKVSAGPWLVSAQGADESHYALTGTNPNGDVQSIDTGFRGHGPVAHPTRASVVLMVARRPGTTLLLADLASSSELARIEAEPGTHFFGHGAFSADGTRLYTTEADIAGEVGLIGVRDAATLELIGHFPSHGVGPHELHLMPDGDTLVVANGGLLTKPETGGAVLNLDTMDPILSYVDRHTGQLLEEVRLDEPKLSIRHLDVAADGTVAFGVQAQREAMSHTDPVALSVTHRRGQPATILEGDGVLWRAFDDYIGSVTVIGGHDVVAMSSPRGNMVGFWRLSTGALLGTHEMPDVCGLARVLDDAYFALTNSFGDVRFIDAQTLSEDTSRRLEHPSLSWDNHLASIVIP